MNYYYDIILFNYLNSKQPNSLHISFISFSCNLNIYKDYIYYLITLGILPQYYVVNIIFITPFFIKCLLLTNISINVFLELISLNIVNISSKINNIYFFFLLFILVSLNYVFNSFITYFNFSYVQL